MQARPRLARDDTRQQGEVVVDDRLLDLPPGDVDELQTGLAKQQQEEEEALLVRLERRTAQPLFRIQRLADRAVGGGFLLMLIASAVLFGMFLLSSLYLQNVLGTGPLATGLGFLPVALAAGAGAHLGSHLVRHAGVRSPMAGAFAVTAGGIRLAQRRTEADAPPASSAAACSA